MIENLSERMVEVDAIGVGSDDPRVREAAAGILGYQEGANARSTSKEGRGR